MRPGWQLQGVSINQTDASTWLGRTSSKPSELVFGSFGVFWRSYSIFSITMYLLYLWQWATLMSHSDQFRSRCWDTTLCGSRGGTGASPLLPSSSRPSPPAALGSLEDKQHFCKQYRKKKLLWTGPLLTMPITGNKKQVAASIWILDQEFVHVNTTYALHEKIVIPKYTFIFEIQI